MGNVLSSGFQCLPCLTKRPSSPKIVHAAEKSADLSSPAVTNNTSTTASPPQLPHVPDISHISKADGHRLTGLTLVAPSPQQRSAHRTTASQSPLSPNIHIPQGKQPDKNASTAVTDPNIWDDSIFDAPWTPGSKLKLADGSDLPWSRGKSTPSAAARYLDDIEG